MLRRPGPGVSAEDFRTTWSVKYPGAVACLLNALDLLVAPLAFARANWIPIRHTNLIERIFGETLRRVKVMGRLPGERYSLSLVWAVLVRASAAWRGITYTRADARILQRETPPPTPDTRTFQEIEDETQEPVIA